MVQKPNHYIHIPGLLSPAELQQVRALMDQSVFVDGRVSASMAARLVKHNEQMSEGEARNIIGQAVQTAIMRHPLVQSAVMPRLIHEPLVARYQPGMTYGLHVDGPFMGTQPPVRTDVACTVFLSDPAAYQGGELLIIGPAGNLSFKLAPGDALFYPATTIHGVMEVTGGVREVAVTWIQSLVRDAERREMLFNLHYLMTQMQARDPQGMESMLVTQTYSNLMRMWAEC